MGGKAFDMSGKMEQFLFREGFRMDSLNLESAACQRPGFVEDHRGELCQSIHIIPALDEDSFVGCTADTGEECERNGDDQRAGTAYDQESQCPVEPGTESGGIAVIEKRRDERQCEGGNDHDRRVDTCEAADERLAVRLVLASILDKPDDLRSCRLAERLVNTHLQHSGKIDTAGDDLHPGNHVTRQALPCQGYGIETGAAFEDGPVQRNLLAGLHDDRLSGMYFFRRYALCLSVPADKGHVRPDIHQF